MVQGGMRVSSVQLLITPSRGEREEQEEIQPLHLAFGNGKMENVFRLHEKTQVC